MPRGSWWARPEPRPGYTGQPGTCPYCGARTWQETLTVHRPGRPSVTQVIARCRAAAVERGRWCPATILEEKDL